MQQRSGFYRWAEGSRHLDARYEADMRPTQSMVASDPQRYRGAFRALRCSDCGRN